jgi:histone-lysine N-methyltransferase ASH1L
MVMFDKGLIIDGYRGSVCRFFNHSCSPNCIIEKWTVGGKTRLGLFAREDGIRTSEELTFDYNFTTFGENSQQCACGSANCRGVLGS